MHPATEKLVTALSELSIVLNECDYAERGYHFEIDLEAARLREFAQCMLEQEMFLGFVGGLHVDPAIEIIYQFASYDRLCRLVLRVVVDSNNAIPTISDIFQGADWHERETRDFYGVIFIDHPNLVPLILAEEDVDLKPLLKNSDNIKESAAVRWVTVEEQPETDEKADKD